MSTPSIESEFCRFFDEWLKTVVSMSDARKRGELKTIMNEIRMLSGLKKANFVNQEGYSALESVAERLLLEKNLQHKVSGTTARKLIIKAFEEDLEKRDWKEVSENAVITAVRRELGLLELKSGTYVFGASFSPFLKNFKFNMGPVSICSKARFYRENLTELRQTWDEREDTRVVMLKHWVKYMAEFDHVITVRLLNYESSLGRDIARECSEFALNLIRTFFGYTHTKRMRLSSELGLEMGHASLVLEDEGVSFFHVGRGPSSHLDEQSMSEFETELTDLSNLFVSFVGWLDSGNFGQSPTIERLRYANKLIAEAYTEQSEHLRLVRVISALEALAIIRSNDKSHDLAVRCACVGAWGDMNRANQIYDVVRDAYRWRNNVVHGDSPSNTEIRSTFSRLEKHLFIIFTGFLSFFAKIESTVRPNSIRLLAREVRERIGLFAYHPELGFD